MNRVNLLMLAMMNDGLNHHRDVIIYEVSKIEFIALSDEEFDILIMKKGHGGESVDGKCSKCLEILNNKDTIQTESRNN